MDVEDMVDMVDMDMVDLDMVDLDMVDLDMVDLDMVDMEMDMEMDMNIGGFQLEFVSITWVINHMTNYKSKCSH